MVDSGSSILNAVEVFDGSTVDPVVVSNVYWAGLKGNILSVIIAQILAAGAFVVLAYVASSQLERLGEFVSSKIPLDEGTKRDVVELTQSTLERAKSPTAEPDFSKLLLCILIDFVGTSSGIIPILGELTDIVWAPIAAFVLRSVYGSNVIFALEFVEEILPLTDLLPLATLCWIIETFYGDTSVAKSLQIGTFRPNLVSDRDKAIDVKGNDKPDTK